MQAIRTVYHGPTTFRGARIKATSSAGTLTLSWDHALSPRDNHRAVAEAFISKMGWNEGGYGWLVTGELPDHSSVHVMTGRADKGG